MKEPYKAWSIQYRIRIPLSIFILLLVSFFTFWNYNSMRQSVQESEISNNDNAVQQMQMTLDIIFRECLVATSYVSIDSDVCQYMDDFDRNKVYQTSNANIAKLISQFSFMKKYIYETGVISFQTNTIYASRQWNQAFPVDIQNYNDISLLESMDLSQRSGNTIFYHWYNHQFPYVLTFIHYNKSGNGACFTSINMSELKNFLPHGDMKQYYIVSGDDTILYSNTSQDMGKKKEEHSILQLWNGNPGSTIVSQNNNQKAIISSEKSGNNDWYYVAIDCSSNISVTSNKLFYFFALIVLLACVGILIIFIVSQRAYEPINRLISSLERKDPITMDNYTNRETKIIARNLIVLLSENKELRNTLNDKIDDLNVMQNTALQYQINPHFLFNTLNLISVCSIKTSGAQNDSVKLILWLSELLRYSLDTKNQLVPLKDELNSIDLYMKIIQKRHGENYRIEYDIPESMYQQKVIRLTFQPLIENAIYHGLQPQGGGIIKISTFCNPDIHTFFVLIKDNGIGMSENEIKKITAQFEQKDLYCGHIGLKNVHDRIQLVHGSHYGLKIMSNGTQNGVTVEMNLPYI